MPNPNLTEIIVILDRSGSMASIKHDMEGGFNTFVAEQAQRTTETDQCVLTLVQFDGGWGGPAVDTVHEAIPVTAVPRLSLVPRGNTPLLDAIGETFTRVGQRLLATPESARPAKVLVLIITDGEENASHQYSKSQVKQMIEHQRDVYKWQILYLGANVDAFAEAGAIGINTAQAAAYVASPRGVGGTFSVASSLADSYRSGTAGQSLLISKKDRKAMLDEDDDEQDKATRSPK